MLSKGRQALPNETRRRLLKVIGVFFLTHPFKASLAAGETHSRGEKKTFAAFLDVLLPRDEFSGSATDLHVDEELWLLSDSDPRFRRLIELGCQWLSMTGGPPFAELTVEQKIALMDWMTKSDINQIPRRFYELVRMTAIEMYYSKPATWRGLSIETPPQPIGYPLPWP